MGIVTVVCNAIVHCVSVLAVVTLIVPVSMYMIDVVIMVTSDGDRV